MSARKIGGFCSALSFLNFFFYVFIFVRLPVVLLFGKGVKWLRISVVFLFVTCRFRLAEKIKVLLCFPPDEFGYGMNESVLSCSVPNGQSSATGGFLSNDGWC